MEECARLSLLKCVDSRYYNTEKAALFLYRTSAREQLCFADTCIVMRQRRFLFTMSS